MALKQFTDLVENGPHRKRETDKLFKETWQFAQITLISWMLISGSASWIILSMMKVRIENFILLGQKIKSI
ncbi:MAG: hypothetical protein ACTSYI_17550 [Promethearchaeota archaeon]